MTRFCIYFTRNGPIRTEVIIVINTGLVAANKGILITVLHRYLHALCERERRRATRDKSLHSRRYLRGSNRGAGRRLVDDRLAATCRLRSPQSVARKPRLPGSGATTPSRTLLL